MNDIIACLGTARYFSKQDLKFGYWQAERQENDKKKTAFTCYRGLFQFKIMPFGLANAPGLFQELMPKSLGQEDFLQAYLDDMQVFLDTVENRQRIIPDFFGSLRRQSTIEASKIRIIQEKDTIFRTPGS